MTNVNGRASNQRADGCLGQMLTLLQVLLTLVIGYSERPAVRRLRGWGVRIALTVKGAVWDAKRGRHGARRPVTMSLIRQAVLLVRCMMAIRNMVWLVEGDGMRGVGGIIVGIRRLMLLGRIGLVKGHGEAWTAGMVDMVWLIR